MRLDDWEGWWKEDGEVRVVTDRVEVEGGYLERLGVFLNNGENGRIDWSSD